MFRFVSCGFVSCPWDWKCFTCNKTYVKNPDCNRVVDMKKKRNCNQCGSEIVSITDFINSGRRHE